MLTVSRKSSASRFVLKARWRCRLVSGSRQLTYHGSGRFRFRTVAIDRLTPFVGRSSTISRRARSFAALPRAPVCTSPGQCLLNGGGPRCPPAGPAGGQFCWAAPSDCRARAQASSSDSRNRRNAPTL